jgi:hypothetical protein
MMKKNLGTMIGILGWGLGWGLSWALITAYQESVAFGFSVQSPKFYLGWYLLIVGLFVLGWGIAGFSTGLMLLIVNKVNIKYGILISLLWGLIAFPLGIILSWIYKHAGGGDSFFFLYLACFYIFLLPIGFGVTGFIGGRATSKILKLTFPSLSQVVHSKSSWAWGSGLTIGVIVGLIGIILLQMIPYIGETHVIDNGFSPVTTRVGIWSVIYSVFPGLISGFLGGSIAGSIGNITIRRNLNKQEIEK